MFSLVVSIYLTKNENRTKKIFNTALTLLLWVKVLFLLKNADFLQNNVAISKIKRALILKGIFSETTYVCVLTCQMGSLGLPRLGLILLKGVLQKLFDKKASATHVNKFADNSTENKNISKQEFNWRITRTNY